MRLRSHALPAPPHRARPGVDTELAYRISDTGYIVGSNNYAMASGPGLLRIVTLAAPAI